MTDESAGPGRLRRARIAFRQWRHTRPFLGGLLVTLGGLEILSSERAPLPVVIRIGLQGLAGYLVPLVLLLCGLLLLFNPVQRTFYALLAVLLSLASWLTSNLGGFFVGMLLGLVGGALAFAWMQRERRGPAQHRGKPPPGRVRTSGLALLRGDGRADTAASRPAAGTSDEAAADRPPQADGKAATYWRRRPDERPGTSRAARWVRTGPSLAPVALSVLAAVAARGLVMAASPAPASAAIPAVTPSIPWLPVPSPSATPSPSPSAAPSARPSGRRTGQPTRSAPAGRRGSASARPGGPHARSPGSGRPHARHRAAASGVPIAADKSILAARVAVLSGLSYDGIAAVPTADGATRMLRFSMNSMKLPAVVLNVTAGGHSFTTKDSSLLLSGHVELLTTRLSGELDGIRVTFTAASPPAGLPPDMTLTRVVAEQPYASADSVRAVGSNLIAG